MLLIFTKVWSLVILNLAVFGSGNGSNCKAIHKAIREKKLNAVIRVIISDQEHAGILDFGRSQDIPSFRINSGQFASKEGFYDKLTGILREHQTEFIVLAGYLKKIGTPLITMFPDKIINIHPALLPSFGGKGMYGLKVHQAVIDAGVKVTGITVHLVDGQYDHGPIVLQRTLEVTPDDTPETLSAKVLTLEHEHYHRAIGYFADSRCKVAGRKVIIHKLMS